MRKKYLVGILFVFILSCKKKEEEVVHFSVINGTSTDVFVEFFTIASGDTENVMIIPHEEFYIREVTLSPYETPNWYRDFDIQINSITNVYGDTLNFNPNIASKWYGTNIDLIYYYSLYLQNSDF